MKLIHILLALAFLAFVGCDAPRHHHIRHKTKTVAVHHLSDGRYCYRDDSGQFWFYMYLMNSGGSSQTTYYVNTSSTLPPRGGAWAEAKETPEEVATVEHEFSASPAVEEAIAVDVSGAPMTFSEMEAEGRDGMDVSETGESESDSSTDSSSDGGGDSGGGDSGGGGDAGGGGQ